MNDVFYSGIKPNLFPHEREAKDIEHAKELCSTTHFWWVNHLSDYSNFDFEFLPQRGSETRQRHAWPSQHQKDSGTYYIPKDGYVDTNYRKDGVVIPRIKSDWGEGNLFDYTWHPDPTDPPYIYVFGNQWYSPEKMSTVEYHVPGATDYKYIHELKAMLPPTTKNWHKLTDAPFEFDYSWIPDPHDMPFIYVFGNQHYSAEVMPTIEYHVPGSTDKKYINDITAKLTPDFDKWNIPAGLNVDKFDFTWCPEPGTPPFVYQFGTQWQKTGGPKYVVPGATDIKYIDSPRAIKKTRDFVLNPSIDSYWMLPEKLIIESFDWTWHPDATESPYIYQFNTQHQVTGGPQYVMAGATEIKYVTQPNVKGRYAGVAICEIDHTDGNAGKIPKTLKTVRYFDNYLSTLKRIAKSIDLKYKFAWICSSICNYTNFDFTWHPVQWQETMLHVFPSDDEKFGDTFFINVQSFLESIDDFESLEDYDLNFTDIPVARRPMPVIAHEYDTQVEAIQKNDWQGPLALFKVGGTAAEMPAVPLWRLQTKTVGPLSKGASQVIIPSTVKPYVKTQVYDYPFIDRTQVHLGYDKPLDIVFIDNGEKDADYNYKYLYRAYQRANDNKIHRSSGVNGRVAAYRAAAELSTTPWFFAVFAKLEVSDTFDWTWQPDRLQEPKHYIFHAENPVNGLVYGHQAMIAYNKKLVLENIAQGLDFTLDQAHEVVPILSGRAYYYTDAWTCWRTAFRECIKLKDSLPDLENEYRLEQWLTIDNTKDQWSMKGAQDAVEYYNAVNGDFVELKKSYEWDWLASYALLKRNLAPNQ